MGNTEDSLYYVTPQAPSSSEVEFYKRTEHRGEENVSLRILYKVNASSLRQIGDDSEGC